MSIIDKILGLFSSNKKEKVEDIRKSHYYYIDESGSIGGNTDLFIHGCVITDSPELIEATLERLKGRISDDAYFDEFHDDFVEQGFHAVENHFDIRAAFYQELAYLDWRAYIIILKKDSDKFRSIYSGSDSNVFKYTLFKLLVDRLRKRKDENNHLVFEDISLQGKSLKSIIDELESIVNTTGKFSTDIRGKEEINLSVIDYINYVVFKVLTSKKPDVRMEQNYRLLASKIAVVHFPHNNVYLSRNNDGITVDKLKEQWRS